MFNYPGQEPFRAALTKAGFYDEWKAKFGAEAWAKLEQVLGQAGLITPRAIVAAIPRLAVIGQPRGHLGLHRATVVLTCSPRSSIAVRIAFPASTRARAGSPRSPPRCWSSPEIAILFAGVVSRYVFNKPLTWSDELASILFLWLAMLGAVIALRRGEHMRLDHLRQPA